MFVKKVLIIFFALLFMQPLAARQKLIIYTSNDGGGYGYEEDYRGDGVWMVRFLDGGNSLPRRKLSMYRAAEFGRQNGYRYVMMVEDSDKYSRSQISSSSISILPDRSLRFDGAGKYDFDRAFGSALPVYVRYASEVDCSDVVCANAGEVPNSVICSSNDISSSINAVCETIIGAAGPVNSQQVRMSAKADCLNVYRKICSVYRTTSDDWIDEIPGHYYLIDDVVRRYGKSLRLKIK